MGPVAMDAEWVPLNCFSVFGFGSPIDHYVENSGCVSREEWKGTLPFERAVRGRYRCGDLDCWIFTVDGLINEFFTQTVCLYNGYNIVGSKVRAALDILEYPEIIWHVPHPDDPMERLGEIPSMGLILDVPDKTGAIYSVVLRPHQAEYREREGRAKALMGNVTSIKGSFRPLV